MRFLHSMLRVSDPDATIRFFSLLGLEERRFGHAWEDREAPRGRQAPLCERSYCSAASRVWLSESR